MARPVHVIALGGTIDKTYSIEQATLVVGSPFLLQAARDMRLQVRWTLESLTQKDSLDLDPAERDSLAAAVLRSNAQSIVVTHGTDTLIASARRVSQALADADAAKTVAFTGAFVPAGVNPIEASFNLGGAFLAAQTLPPGVYVVIGGMVLDARTAVKDGSRQRFIGVQG